jgi:hypothetical protein
LISHFDRLFRNKAAVTEVPAVCEEILVHRCLLVFIVIESLITSVPGCAQYDE